jgi:hypothetical protein
MPAETPNPGSGVYYYPSNWEGLKAVYTISADAEAKLLANGFVVLDYIKPGSISSCYNSLTTNIEISPFITTDALLLIYHLSYDHMLQTLEKQILDGKLLALLVEFYADVKKEYQSISSGTFMKEPARKLWIYASVALALIRGETTAVDTEAGAVLTEANDYLSKVYAHGIQDSEDDYTQYTPRGHYAGDAILEQYFKSMMWLQRRTFSLNDEGIAQAGIMGFVVARSSLILDPWNYINDLITKLVTVSVGNNAVMVDKAMSQAFGSNYAASGYMLLE